MHIGIVGGGAAGLIAAWLLEERHRVTLFEREDRLGGHAHTVEVDLDGTPVPVDAGFEFFSAAMFPTFCRLLQLLKVEVREYPMRATLYARDGSSVYALPPLRSGRIHWPTMTPSRLADLLRFRSLLREARPLMESDDRTTTLVQFLDRYSVTERFRQRFLYPFLQASWCVERQDLLHFVAYNALRYAYLHQPAGVSSRPWLEVEGGMSRYVAVLVRDLQRTELQLSSPIRRILPGTASTASSAAYRIETESGKSVEVDGLVIATGAPDAATLLADLPAATERRRALRQIEAFDTRIALHGDPRFMPVDRRDWGTVNIRHDERHSALTIWKPWRSRRIFRSWTTFENEEPDPTYDVVRFRHPKITRSYFQAQEEITPLQGRHRLWLAGMYTQDVDCHESAVRSAVRVAEELAPHGERLRRLRGAAVTNAGSSADRERA